MCRDRKTVRVTPCLKTLGKHRLLKLSVVMALALTYGCGIPCRRCALSGPSLPQSYHINNGTKTWAYYADKTSENAEDTDPKITAEAEGGVEKAKAISKIQLTHFTGFTELRELFDPAPETFDSQKKSETEPLNNNAEDADKKTDSKQHNIEAASSSLEQISASAKVVQTVAAVETPSLNAPIPLPFPVEDEEPEKLDLINSYHIPLHQFFGDPVLVDLIRQAMTGNQELRILAEEINIARNEVTARSGEYRPFVNYGLGAGIDKSSRFTRNGAVEDSLEVAPGHGFPEPLPDFMVAANISWELDVWNKLRNAQRSAAMRYFGTREGRNYILTRLVAEIAENYYELLALDNRMLILNRTIEIQQKSLEIAQAKKEAGRETELSVQRFQAEVRKNESEKLLIQQEIVETENRINFLVGRYPQPVERQTVDYIGLNLNMLSTGLPSELLQNRADIRQAEREIAAARLNIEVARARFYPSFGIHAGVGLNAHNMKYLLSTPESLLYNATVDLVGPLINKRAIQADYRTANAEQLQAVYHYQRTILNAYIEVVNHMSKAENYRQSIEIKKGQLIALEKSVEVANNLFQNARAEYVEVLLAQRELMEARMLLIDTKNEQLSAFVNTYQALGGGSF